MSLKEISKNETLNVQEDLQENTDGHLTVFDVLESIVRKEVILQQHIDNCNLKKPQTQSARTCNTFYCEIEGSFSEAVNALGNALRNDWIFSLMI